MHFNPTLVQLESAFQFQAISAEMHFNPTLVQLELKNIKILAFYYKYFNPTLVQLESLKQSPILTNTHTFQSHIGAIRILRDVETSP